MFCDGSNLVTPVCCRKIICRRQVWSFFLWGLGTWWWHQFLILGGHALISKFLNKALLAPLRVSSTVRPPFLWNSVDVLAHIAECYFVSWGRDHCMGLLDPFDTQWPTALQKTFTILDDILLLQHFFGLESIQGTVKAIKRGWLSPPTLH